MIEKKQLSSEELEAKLAGDKPLLGDRILATGERTIKHEEVEAFDDQATEATETAEIEEELKPILEGREHKYIKPGDIVKLVSAKNTSRQFGYYARPDGVMARVMSEFEVLESNHDTVVCTRGFLYSVLDVIKIKIKTL